MTRLPSILVPFARVKARFMSSSVSNSINAYPVGFPVSISLTILTDLISPYRSNSRRKISSSSHALNGNLATNSVAYGSPVAFSSFCGSQAFKASFNIFLPFSNFFFVFSGNRANFSFSSRFLRFVSSSISMISPSSFTSTSDESSSSWPFPSSAPRVVGSFFSASFSSNKSKYFPTPVKRLHVFLAFAGGNHFTGGLALNMTNKFGGKPVGCWFKLIGRMSIAGFMSGIIIGGPATPGGPPPPPGGIISIGFGGNWPPPIPPPPCIIIGGGIILPPGPPVIIIIPPPPPPGGPPPPPPGAFINKGLCGNDAFCCCCCCWNGGRDPPPELISMIYSISNRVFSLSLSVCLWYIFRDSLRSLTIEQKYSIYILRRGVSREENARLCGNGPRTRRESIGRFFPGVLSFSKP
jgi:hypothetical protein